MFGKFRFQDISRTYWNPNQVEERYRKASTTTAIFHWNFLKFKIFFHGRRLADASLGGPVYESNYKHHDTNIEK